MEVEKTQTEKYNVKSEIYVYIQGGPENGTVFLVRLNFIKY